jgi:hypothetical protein
MPAHHKADPGEAFRTPTTQTSADDWKVAAELDR